MSLITELRCKEFEDIIGNESVKNILQCIIRNPEDKPRNLILSGNYGNSKTTIARIFANKLNSGSTEESKYLMEIDSSTVTKVDDMRELLPYISLPVKNFYKVILFDEAHLISKASFSLLLKTIEENTKNLFFIFCTTELHKMLDTIKSRSITLYLQDLNFEDMKIYLKKLSECTQYFQSEWLEDEELLNILFMQSRGHYRDLIQQIELIRIQGLQDYRNSVIDYQNIYRELLNGNEEALLKILKLPNILIGDSWDYFIKMTEVPENILVTHLTYRDKLHSTVDWYIFFNLMRKKERKQEVSKIRK